MLCGYLSVPTDVKINSARYARNNDAADNFFYSVKFFTKHHLGIIIKYRRLFGDVLRSLKKRLYAYLKYIFSFFWRDCLKKLD